MNSLAEPHTTSGRGIIHVAAVAADLLALHGSPPADLSSLNPDDSTPARRRAGVSLLLCWLLADPELITGKIPPTGKSTLAAALACEFGTSYVSEYGRELWDERRGQFVFDDLLAIACEQVRREEAALRNPGTNRFLFCDTTPLTTLFYRGRRTARSARPSPVSAR